MSIASMTNVAFARRSDTTPSVPNGVAAVNEAAHGSDPSNDSVTSALGAIVAYFPSEINILYAAIVAAITATATKSLSGQWMAFWFTLGLTPLAVWFVYAARVHAAGKELPLKPQTWPIMEMVVGAIAFAIWAGTLPGSPLQQIPNYTPTLAGVVLLVGTTLLGWIAAIFQRTINA
jgi:hypothetical protein